MRKWSAVEAGHGPVFVSPAGSSHLLYLEYKKSEIIVGLYGLD